MLLGEAAVITENYFWCVIILLTTILWIVRNKNIRSMVALFFMFIFFVMGVLNIMSTGKKEKLCTEIGDRELPCTVSGKIKEIKTDGLSDTYYIMADSIVSSEFAYKGKIGIVIYTSAGKERKNNPGNTDHIYLDYINGDYICMSGTVSVPDSAANPGTFDQYIYLRNKGYYLCISNGTIESGNHRPYSIEGFLYGIKNRCTKIIDNSFDSESAGIVKAMLVADKSTLDKNIKKLYSENGIAHIMAISGVHVAIIGMTLYGFLRKLRIGRLISGTFSIAIIILYGIMTGMSSSTERAVIMLILSIAAEYFGRKTDAPTSMGFAMIIMVLGNPYVILDAGFQLSFAAITGVTVVAPQLRKLLRMFKCFIKEADEKKKQKHKKIMSLRKMIIKLIDALVVGIASFITTTPVIIYYYYQFPPYSILINLIVIPLVSLVVGGSILVVLTGLFFTGAAVVMTYPVRLILFGYKYLCIFASGLPGASVLVGHISIGMVFVYYLSVVLMFAILRMIRIGKTERGGPILYLMLATVLFLTVVYEVYSYDKSLKVVYMDVGQGDGVLLRTSGHGGILIDGGSSSNKRVGEYVMVPVLKYYGVSEVEYAFVSHGDVDHVSGLEYLLNEEQSGVHVVNLVLPEYGDQDALQELKSEATANNVNIIYMKPGDNITYNHQHAETINIECLYPDEEAGQGVLDTNNLSMILKTTITWDVREADIENLNKSSDSDASLSLLFVGDAGIAAEKRLIELYEKNSLGEISDSIACDILKVGHHGSRNSSGSDFLKRVSAMYGIISCGKDNRYGHPHAETLERLKMADTKYMTTKEHGAIILSIERGDWSLSGYID
ncbi:dNA internalization competence protein ComEC/Rec2-like protein [Coprococcus sp. CAG:782]|nr:dNA internalization competence protein ComEC/Rec2-like protein [Coprococcus sp. CAG:782]